MASAERGIVPFPREKIARDAHEIAFLPAALEIAETPPSPIGRAIVATILGVFCIGLVWATFGMVDIVATANGRIVPSGGAKLIQPFETGVVGAIRVRDGQKVKAGESLIELDPTITGAEHERLKAEMIAADLEVARLRAALSWRGEADPTAGFDPPAAAGVAQIETQRRYLVSQIAEHGSRLAEIERQISQREAERTTVEAGIARLEATIPVLQERVDVRKHLYDKALGTRLVYLTEFQELVGMKQDVGVQRSRLQEADAAIAALRETRRRAESEFSRGVLSDLTRAEQRAAAARQEVVKAEKRTRLQVLTAPVDGVVQQLAVHTVGGVVTPAQALAVVVPETSALEIEATLANQDVGFVHAGQEAAIKVTTFNFTRYGLLRGSVRNVSQDAVAQSPKNRTTGADGASADRQDEAFNYVVHVSLDRTEMNVDGRMEKLSPGMAVSVEIRTGARRIISYLLSPLEKQRQESLRER